MSIKNKLFAAWTRDNHRFFAEAVANELNNKANTKDLEQKVSKDGDTMSGNLTLKVPAGSGAYVFPLEFKGKYKDEKNSQEYRWSIGISTIGTTFYVRYANMNVFCISPSFISCVGRSSTLGFDKQPWGNTYTKKISNGTEDIEVPSKAGTMALVSDIEDILRKHNLIPQETTPPEEKE